MSLTFERRGTTWTCADDHWEVMLIARNVYHGTERIVATLTLARDVPGVPRQLILTDRLDLMVATKRKNFAREAAERLADLGAKSGLIANQASVLTIMEKFQEHLIVVAGDIESHGLLDIVVPDDMTPPYTLWPLVPSSRPGMLVSPSGSGKSTLAAAVGLSVVSGKSLLPRLEPRIEGPVLYIGQEESKEQWASRVTQMCVGHEIPPPKHMHYMKLANASLVESSANVAEKASMIGAKLVIIDSAQATWGAESESVRGWATQWFNAVEMLEIPSLVIDHPNRAETGKPSEAGFAAGSSVKRDRVGHSWAMKSLQMPTTPGEPIRYHVTLRDTKRNYVAKQDDIIYETIISGYEWIRLEEAEELTAEMVVDASRLFGQMVGAVREDVRVEGWTTEELASAIGQKDGRRVRTELNLGLWRADPSNTETKQVTFTKVQGTGSRGNPAKYVLETRNMSVQLDLEDDIHGS